MNNTLIRLFRQLIFPENGVSDRLIFACMYNVSVRYVVTDISFT